MTSRSDAESAFRVPRPTHPSSAFPLAIGPLIVSHRTRVIQIVPLIASHRSHDTNKALTICNKLQIVLFAPGPNGREFSYAESRTIILDDFRGELNWREHSWWTILDNSLERLPRNTTLGNLLGSYLWKFSWHTHIRQKDNKRDAMSPGELHHSGFSVCIWHTHKRQHACFFWQIVKPTRFFPRFFQKQKGGCVI